MTIRAKDLKVGDILFFPLSKRPESKITKIEISPKGRIIVHVEDSWRNPEAFWPDQRVYISP